MQISKQIPSMNANQMKSYGDRFDEQIKMCDQDLRKMFIECQHLKDEEHNEADYYYKKYSLQLLRDLINLIIVKCFRFSFNLP